MSQFTFNFVCIGKTLPVFKLNHTTEKNSPPARKFWSYTFDLQVSEFREFYSNKYIPFSSLVAQTKISTQTALVKTINLNLLTLQRDSPPVTSSSHDVFTNPEYTEPEFFS